MLAIRMTHCMEVVHNIVFVFDRYFGSREEYDIEMNTWTSL